MLGILTTHIGKVRGPCVLRAAPVCCVFCGYYVPRQISGLVSEKSSTRLRDFPRELEYPDYYCLGVIVTWPLVMVKAKSGGSCD